jgi:hypothetical protein
MKRTPASRAPDHDLAFEAEIDPRLAYAIAPCFFRFWVYSVGTNRAAPGFRVGAGGGQSGDGGHAGERLEAMSGVAGRQCAWRRPTVCEPTSIRPGQSI